jgi:predicted RNase H-like HicB family nuclease
MDVTSHAHSIILLLAVPTIMGEAMKYAVILEQGPTSIGVTVPDLPGCFAVAPNLPEARTLIAEAIAFHIESLREDGLPVPEPTTHAEDVHVTA